MGYLQDLNEYYIGAKITNYFGINNKNAAQK